MMSGLRKVETPIYELVLPVSKEKIKYRPFVRKERRNIMIASEGGNQNDLLLAIYEMIKACSFDTCNPEKMASADVEYLFVSIRNKSTGENLEAYHNCYNCSNKTLLLLNLEHVVIEGNAGVETVQISDDCWIELRPPTIAESTTFEDNPNEEELADIIRTCTVKIIQGSDVVSDFTREEFVDWLGGLTEQQGKKIEEYFASLPRLVFEKKYECSKCGAENHIVVEGLADFFD